MSFNADERLAYWYDAVKENSTRKQMCDFLYSRYKVECEATDESITSTLLENIHDNLDFQTLQLTFRNFTEQCRYHSDKLESDRLYPSLTLHREVSKIKISNDTENDGSQSDGGDSGIEDLELLAREITDLFELIANDKKFQERYKFGLGDYLANRKEFYDQVTETADHIDKVQKNTGITRGVAGGTGLLSGALTISGIILAPVTAGTSLSLTAAGIATGTASAVAAGGSELVKDKLIKKKCMAIQNYLATFESQEKITTILFQDYISKMEKLSTYRGDKVAQVFGALTVSKGVGTAIFASSNVTTSLLGRAGAAITSGTVQIFSGVLAGVGIVFSVWDLVEGIKNVKNPNEVAIGLRSFAKDYKKDTEALELFILNAIKSYTE